MKIPIVCETPDCPNNGLAINVTSEIPDDQIDAFFENFDGSNKEDYCPLCGALGIAEDPIEDDEIFPVIAGHRRF